MQARSIDHQRQLSQTFESFERTHIAAINCCFPFRESKTVPEALRRSRDQTTLQA